MLSYEPFLELFFSKLEKDTDFFALYNLTEEEILDIAVKRSKVYLKEAYSQFKLNCTLEFQFLFDDNLAQISVSPDNINVTFDEINIIAELMREICYDRDLAKLRAFQTRFSPTDLNSFSPANERTSFLKMCEYIKKNNNMLIDNYDSRDRLTGKRKLINYDSYEEV